jgi:excisionase family DNA binding protein
VPRPATQFLIGRHGWLQPAALYYAARGVTESHTSAGAVAEALGLLEYGQRNLTRAEEVAVRDTSMQQPAPSLAGLPNHLLTIPEVAEFLNVPLRWVRDAVQQRRVRCTRIGKHVRFTLNT